MHPCKAVPGCFPGSRHLPGILQYMRFLYNICVQVLILLFVHDTYIHAQQGILCNSQCPDKLQLTELTSNNWHIGIKILIAVLITSLTVLCVIIKVLFFFWRHWLEKKQKNLLESSKNESSTDFSTKKVNKYHALVKSTP